MFESLLTGNSEEPTTAYGLLAEDVTVAPDLLSATFRLRPEARLSTTARRCRRLTWCIPFDALVGKLAAPQFRTMLCRRSKRAVA